MRRYIPVPGHPGLKQNVETKIYYVRLYRKGKGECYRSTKETNLYRASLKMNEILTRFLGSNPRRDSTKYEWFGDEVIEMYRSGAIETFKNYERHHRLHLKPYFADFYLHEIGPEWKKYVAYQKSINPKRKLKHDKMVMSVILNHAVERNFLDAAPKLQIPKGDKRATPGREYSNEELNALLSSARGNQALHLEMQLKLGMRAGEVDKLMWSYIDFAHGTITLPPEVVKTREGRKYPVDPIILKKLYQRKLESQSPFVFPNRRDPLRPKSRSDKQFQRLKERTGVSGRRHWLRHTAITRFLRAGVSAAMVQKALGVSEKTMKDVYLHVGKEDADKLATAIGESLAKK